MNYKDALRRAECKRCKYYESLAREAQRETYLFCGVTVAICVVVIATILAAVYYPEPKSFAKDCPPLAPLNPPAVPPAALKYSELLKNLGEPVE